MHAMFDRIVSLRVCDVMSSQPVTVNRSCSMADVSRLFASHGLHAAPVVDDAGRCVGIITASDFVKRTDLMSQSEQQLHELRHDEQGILLEPKSCDYVTDCMSEGIQAVTPVTPLIRAAKMMTSAHLHTIPVVESHKPVGILSSLDVVAALVNAFEEAKNSI